MNKKFSTLVAGVLLATSVGTVTAQGFTATLPAFDNGGANAKSVADQQYYQLAGYTSLAATGNTAAGGVLTMVETSPNSGKYELKYVVNADNANLNNTLWSVSSRDNGFGTLLFTFTNKGTGEVLSINTADATKENAGGTAALATDAIKVGGTISEWRWYNFNKESTKTFDGTALIEASFANGDSTVALGFNSKSVVAVKAKNNDTYQATFAAANQLKVTPYTANKIALSAFDLNTRLQSIKDVKNFNLKFTPDAVGNQWKNWFSNQTLVAEAVAPAETGLSTTIYPHANAAAYTEALAKDAQENDVTTWVRLKDATATSKKYVYVDTAFVASQNVAYADRHLKLALDTLNSEKVGVVGTDLTQNYIDAMAQRAMFQFTLYPSNDSVVVKAGNADIKKEATKYWKMGTQSLLVGDYTVAPITDVATLVTALGDVNSQKNGAQLTTNAKLVKLVYLTEKTSSTAAHSEVTVGAAETSAAGLIPATTLRTKITLTEDAKTARVKTTLASGLYFINLKSDLAIRAALNGAYWTANINGDELRYAKEESSQSLGTIQNFGHMPQAQWVVEQSAYGVAGQQTVTITNREFPTQTIANVQLYKAGDGSVQAVYAGGDVITAADSLTFAEVKTVKPEVKAAYTDTHFGYLTVDSMVLDERIFNLDYLSGIKMGNYVNVLDSKTDSIIYVDIKGEKVTLVLETVPAKAEGFYGYSGNLTKGATKLFPQVRRTAYNIKVKDGNKLIANSKYVVRVDGDKNATGKPIYAVSDVKKGKAAQFFLKENNNVVPAEGKETCYYALVEAIATATTVGNWATADSLYTIGANRAGIKDGSLVMSSEKKTEERIAAFALTEDNSPLYRRLGVTNKEDGFADNDTAWAKIYTINSSAKEYLYEDAYSKYSVDANGKSLGINFLGLEGKGDDAPSAMYIDTAYVRYGTNMPQYMIAVNVTAVPAGKWCPDHAEHNTPEYIATHGDCGHRVPTQGYKMGRYLINAEDSVKTAVNGKDYIWNREYTRLAFVQAKHIADTLVICRNGVPSTLSKDSIFLGDNKHNAITTARPYGTKNPVFAFRLINDQPQADFLIESEGDRKIPTEKRSGWIKIQNGVPVIARYQAGYKEAIVDAEKFNIDTTKDVPTDNETIETTEVSVIAGNGSVSILNAAAKTVTVSNILGQTIAQTVLTSDNATIAVPAGIVVVAVEGEAAVKAIIK